MITLVKHTVHKARRVLYFPVDFLAQIHAPIGFVLALGRLTVKVDAPLRAFLVKVSK